MLTTKISAVFLAAVLFAGAITVASPVLVDEAQAAGEKKKDKKKYKDRYDGKERYYEKYRDYDKRDRPYASDVQVNNKIYIECNLADDHGKNIDGQKRVGGNSIQSTDDLIEAMVNGGNGKNGKNGKFGGAETIVDLESKFKDFCKIVSNDGKPGKPHPKPQPCGQSGECKPGTNEVQTQALDTQIQQVFNDSNIQCTIADDGGVNVGQDQEIKNKIKEVLSADDDLDLLDLSEIVTIIINKSNFDCSINDIII